MWGAFAWGESFWGEARTPTDFRALSICDAEALSLETLWTAVPITRRRDAESLETERTATFYCAEE